MNKEELVIGSPVAEIQHNNVSLLPDSPLENVERERLSDWLLVF